MSSGTDIEILFFFFDIPREVADIIVGEIVVAGELN